MANCRQCGKFFRKARQDAFYCSDKCAAQGWREGDEHTHAEKAHTNTRNCDHCGNPYEYNDYAERGGKRQSRFCSAKCRVAAHRAEKRNSTAGYSQYHAQEDTRRQQNRQQGTSGGAGGQGASGSQSRQQGYTRADYERMRQEQQQRQQQRQQQNARQNTHNAPPRDFKRDNPYEVLGVDRNATQAQIKAAWRKLCRQYHPDVNKSPDAEEMMKRVNFAYDRVKV